MRTLLQLQVIDLHVERIKAREQEIPRQKEKFDIHRKRLAAELQASEQRCRDLMLEQRECERDIQEREAQIKKYETQLLSVRKNEEYQALLHEIETLKKQISLKEERVIGILVDADEAKAHLEEDRKRIETELREIERECAQIDEELAQAVAERKALEQQRDPLLKQIDRGLLSRYSRIRSSKKTGAALVPLRNDSCSGCHMRVTPQIVNEIMAGDKIHTCHHCGRLLYHAENLDDVPQGSMSE